MPRFKLGIQYAANRFTTSAAEYWADRPIKPDDDGRDGGTR
jgi:hypothetical protein